MNGVIIPEDVMTNKRYRDVTNSYITVYRPSKHVRVMTIWNCSLNEIISVRLDAIDYPVEVVDSPLFVTNDAKMGRVRIDMSGNISGWVASTYGSGSFVTSDTSKTFITFAYAV